MSDYLAKPKRKPKNNDNRLNWLLTKPTLFEFVATAPLEECATRLRAEEQKLIQLAASLEIASIQVNLYRIDATTYLFGVLSKGNFACELIGHLESQSDTVTLITGSAQTQGMLWLSLGVLAIFCLLCVLGVIHFGVPAALGLLAALVILRILESQNRHHFIGQIIGAIGHQAESQKKKLLS